MNFWLVFLIIIGHSFLLTKQTFLVSSHHALVHCLKELSILILPDKAFTVKQLYYGYK